MSWQYYSYRKLDFLAILLLQVAIGDTESNFTFNVCYNLPFSVELLASATKHNPCCKNSTVDHCTTL